MALLRGFVSIALGRKKRVKLHIMDHIACRNSCTHEFDNVKILIKGVIYLKKHCSGQM